MASASIVPAVPRVLIAADDLPKADDDRPGEPGEAEDPAKTAERIAKNAKALGDKLADQDTGPDTLTGQDKLKKDIDSLIKALENQPPMGNPPPMGAGGGGGQQKQPMGGGFPKGGLQPMGGQQPKGGQQPQSGRQQQPMGSNRGGQQQQPQQPIGGQLPQQGKPDQQSGGQPKEQGSSKNQPTQAGGKPMPAGGQPGGGGMANPALPLDEAIARDFWGNLPDLPRQRMLQFFREQYMSRYKELLPQYYQSLAEKGKKGKK
jgi:hypothetical protein